MRQPQLVAVSLLLIAACMVGGTAQKYPPATGPAGAIVRLRLEDKTTIEGELLAVEESTVLVLQNREILRVALSVVRLGTGPKISFSGRNLSERSRTRLRLLSRFPQGVSAELEPRLIHAYGQTTIRVIP